MSGQTAEESKKIDDYKDKMADKYGTEVIRIDCVKSNLEYIKNNILIKLSKLFDLSNIDWNLAEEFALSSLIRKCCEIKRDNPDFTTTQIGQIMKLHQCTIAEYLKKGSKIWSWINYDPDEEKSKVSSKNGKSNGKKVEIFENGLSLGVFESCADLERKSEELVGVMLRQGHMSQVCRGERKQYKGFQFKYIN